MTKKPSIYYSPSGVAVVVAAAADGAMRDGNGGADGASPASASVQNGVPLLLVLSAEGRPSNSVTMSWACAVAVVLPKCSPRGSGMRRWASTVQVVTCAAVGEAL